MKTGITHPKDEPVDPSRIEWIRMGTTVVRILTLTMLAWCSLSPALSQLGRRSPRTVSEISPEAAKKTTFNKRGNTPP